MRPRGAAPRRRPHDRHRRGHAMDATRKASRSCSSAVATRSADALAEVRQRPGERWWYAGVVGRRGTGTGAPVFGVGTERRNSLRTFGGRGRARAGTNGSDPNVPRGSHGHNGRRRFTLSLNDRSRRATALRATNVNASPAKQQLAYRPAAVESARSARKHTTAAATAMTPSSRCRIARTRSVCCSAGSEPTAWASGRPRRSSSVRATTRAQLLGEEADDDRQHRVEPVEPVVGARPGGGRDAGEHGLRDRGALACAERQPERRAGPRTAATPTRPAARRARSG